MGFLERFRGGRGGGRGDGSAPSPAADTAAPTTTGGGGAPVSDAGAAPRVVAAAWPTLPPIQRAAAGRTSGVADAGFGGRLATWQNPSFTGTGFHAVLDAAPGGLMSSLRTAPPVAEPERVAAPPRPTPFSVPSPRPRRSLPARPRPVRARRPGRVGRVLRALRALRVLRVLQVGRVPTGLRLRVRPRARPDRRLRLPPRCPWCRHGRRSRPLPPPSRRGASGCPLRARSPRRGRPR